MKNNVGYVIEPMNTIYLRLPAAICSRIHSVCLQRGKRIDEVFLQIIEQNMPAALPVDHPEREVVHDETREKLIDAAHIKKLVSVYAGINVPIDQISDKDNLFHLGMSSFSAAQLMLALEEEFEIEFPDNLLDKNSFSSIEVISHSIRQVLRDISADVQISEFAETFEGTGLLMEVLE